MGRAGSPYRKAKRAAGKPSLRLTSFPRRSRVLLYAVIASLVFYSLPKPQFQLGRALVFFLFGSDVATSLTTGSRGADVLKYVDPLIGTTNGGHVFPGATLPYGLSTLLIDILIFWTSSVLTQK
jgi:hypothetical protein